VTQPSVHAGTGRPRTHVITGAASGMGLEVARRLVERGDDVVALVRSQMRMRQMYDGLPGLQAVQVADLADIAELSDVALELASACRADGPGPGRWRAHGAVA